MREHIDYIGPTGQGKSTAAQYIHESLNVTWEDDVPDLDPDYYYDDKEMYIQVGLRKGDEPAWRRFQDDLRTLMYKYDDDLALSATGFDVPETIDGSVVSESGIRELDSVPRPETETQ